MAQEGGLKKGSVWQLTEKQRGCEEPRAIRSIIEKPIA
jgi:hypothetical protein